MSPSIRKNKRWDREYSAEAREQFFASDDWYRVRLEVLHRDRHTCLSCGATRFHGAVLTVDHIVPLSVNWSRRLDKSNLQCLCWDCNTGKKRLTIDYRRFGRSESADRNAQQRAQDGPTNGFDCQAVSPQRTSVPETPKPNHQTVVLTRDLIDSLRTNGSFTTKTLRAIFGKRIKKHMTAGWVGRLEGKTITQEAFEKAKAGMFQYAKRTLKLRARRNEVQKHPSPDDPF